MIIQFNIQIALLKKLLAKNVKDLRMEKDAIIRQKDKEMEELRKVLETKNQEQD